MARKDIALGSLLLLWTGTAYAAPEWRVTEVSGNVRLTQGKDTHPAARGTVLAAGAVIATAPGARAVVVRGEEYVIISSNSQLRLPAANAGGVTQMVEDFGNALFRIVKKATPHFGVETPYLAAVVKGTTFSVTVGDSGASVQVLEGAVEVATKDGGARELVQPGVVALVGARDRMRLTIEGSSTKTIDSPARATEPTHAPAVIGTVSTSPSTEDPKQDDNSTPDTRQVPKLQVSAEALAENMWAESDVAKGLAGERASSTKIIDVAVAAQSTDLAEATAGAIKGQTGIVFADVTPGASQGLVAELSQTSSTAPQGALPIPAANPPAVPQPTLIASIAPEATPVVANQSAPSSTLVALTDASAAPPPTVATSVAGVATMDSGPAETSLQPTVVPLNASSDPVASSMPVATGTVGATSLTSLPAVAPAPVAAGPTAQADPAIQSKADVEAAKKAAEAAQKAADQQAKADAEAAKQATAAAQKLAEQQAKADAATAKQAAEAAKAAAAPAKDALKVPAPAK